MFGHGIMSARWCAVPSPSRRLGDLLLSKSTHNKTILWQPDRHNKRRADAVNVLQA